MRGKVYLANLRNYKDCKTEINFLIANSNKGMHGNLIHVPILAPSNELLSDILNSETEETRQANLDKFKIYKSRPAVRAMLFDMRQLLDLGKNICLICYCEETARCHRRIVGNWFADLGYEVIFD